MFKQIHGHPGPNFTRSRLRLLSHLLFLLWILLAYCAEVHARDRRLPQPQLGSQQQSTVTQTSGEVTTLEPGRAVERELAGGLKHRYQISLVADQYVRVIVEQRGVDVLARLQSPDGKLITESDREIRIQGQEVVELVAKTNGAYVLEIEAKYKMFPAGRYEIRLVESRTATDEDRLLQEARELYREAFQLTASGKYDEAQSLSERVLEMREKTTGPDHPDVGYTLVLMANIAYYKGDYAKAEQHYRRAASVFEKTLGAEYPYLATCLNNLASLYQAKDDLRQSELLHKRALEIREKSLVADHPDIAQSLNNLANVYNTKRDYENAEPLYLRALAINEKVLGPDHINLAYPLNNLAGLYSRKGEYDKAELLFQRALSIREKKLGAEHPSVASVLYGLGEVYFYKDDYQKAEAFHQRALAIQEKRLGPNHPDVARSLNDLAGVYFQENDYKRAEEFFQRSLAIKEDALGPEHFDTINTLNNLATLYMAKGDLARAVTLKTRVIGAGEHNLDLNLAVGSERQKQAYIAKFLEQMSQTISLHVRFAADDRAARELAATTVLQRKGRVQDVLSNILGSLRSRSREEDRAFIDQLNETTSQLARLVLNGPQVTPPAEYKKRIKTLEEEREKLESEISLRSAGFYQPEQPVTLATVQAAIPDDAALVELVVYRPFDPRGEGKNEAYEKPRYVAYVMRHQGDVQWKELGEAQAIDVAVDKLRQALSDPLRKDVQQLARAVDEKVMQPVRALTGDARQLLISPDGELNLVPFAALADEHGRYLIERYSFSYLTSGRDLLRLQVPRESKSPPVVVADPAFGEPAVIAAANGDAGHSKGAGERAQLDYAQIFFGPLPGVGDEVRALKQLLPQATFLTKERATKAALRQVHAPSILHIATHGFFLQNDPPMGKQPTTQTKDQTRLGKWVVGVENPLLRSGLALAGANQARMGNEDGVLTAFEATGLDLWGTKLVVLSACDTGIGEVKNGDGVYGLRRAFVLAGAASLMMSLWPVSDLSTRALMIGYYKGLVEGRGRGEALRSVQLRMLQSKAHRHPYYWASFIQTGEWANLEGKR